jgi:uncharacterized protein involved in outer membrane biogenesis
MQSADPRLLEIKRLQLVLDGASRQLDELELRAQKKINGHFSPAKPDTSEENALAVNIMKGMEKLRQGR